ncbi:MAG: hypothetical protein J2P31_11710, partial [Blastocatellia bacterium]|nr:hypothetical protein [Blastocatellia bacterium]
ARPRSRNPARKQACRPAPGRRPSCRTRTGPQVTVVRDSHRKGAAPTKPLLQHPSSRRRVPGTRR